MQCAITGFNLCSATQELAGAVSDNEDMLKKKDAEIKRKEEELAAREAEGQEAHKVSTTITKYTWSMRK